MKNNLTELVFILDRSGSMCGLEKDTIGGFNSMLARQRNEPGEAYEYRSLPLRILPFVVYKLSLSLL